MELKTIILILMILYVPIWGWLIVDYFKNPLPQYYNKFWLPLILIAPFPGIIIYDYFRRKKRQEDGHRAVIQIDDIDYLRWPQKCTSCGTDITDSIDEFDINITKHIGAIFSKKNKTMSASVCHACLSKISGNKHLALFLSKKYSDLYGWVCCYSIIAFIFLSWQAALGLLIAALIADLISKLVGRIFGIKCTRKSKDVWTFEWRIWKGVCNSE